MRWFDQHPHFTVRSSRPWPVRSDRKIMILPRARTARVRKPDGTRWLRRCRLSFSKGPTEGRLIDALNTQGSLCAAAAAALLTERIRSLNIHGLATIHGLQVYRVEMMHVQGCSFCQPSPEVFILGRPIAWVSVWLCLQPTAKSRAYVSDPPLIFLPKRHRGRRLIPPIKRM